MRLRRLPAFFAALIVPLLPGLLVPNGLTSAFGQTKVYPRIVVMPNLPPPRMTFIGDDGKPHFLGLTKVGVSVQIVGPLAQTTLTLTFKNDNSRPLEGNLDFPLPENAVLSGYALNVNDTMVDGVPVEKQEARQIFEAEERKRVDPGLLEQTVGNNFRTRIYPMPPHGTRTVRVKYVADLQAVNGDLVYRVPLRWGVTVPEAHFFLDARQNPIAPLLAFGGRERLLPVTDVGGGLLGGTSRYVMDATLKEIKLDSDLTVRLPGLANHGHAGVELFTPADSAAGSAADAGYYFAISDVPPPLAGNPLQSGQAQLARPVDRPAHIGVVWDASLSRLHSDTRHELQVLADALRAIGNANVDVVVLRNVAEPARSFRVTNGDGSALLAFLRAQPFDGGTDLSAVHFARGVGANSDAFYLLFTDGIDTLGGDAPLPASAPIYAVTTDPRANHGLLRRLSEETGGAYLNLGSMTDTAAVAALGRNPLSLLGVVVTSGATADVFPKGVQPVAGRTTVSGRLLSRDAIITLSYGFRDPLNGRDQIVARHEYTLHQANATRSDADLVARYWARQQAAELALQPDRNHDALLALGRGFNIVTPSTSFLVLESLQQYLQYNITPPRSQPALYEQWLKLHVAHSRDEKVERADKLTQVLALWREKTAWYEHPPKPEEQKRYPMVGVGAYSSQMANRSFAAQSMSRSEGDSVRRVTMSAAPMPVAQARTYHGAAAPAGAMADTGISGGGAFIAGRHSLHAGVVGGDAPAFTLNMPVALGEIVRDNPRGGETKSIGVVGGQAMDEPLDAKIAIKQWTPDTPYLTAMRAAGPKGAYAAYLRERSRGGYETSPAFYLDCAEYLIQIGQPALGVRVLTGINDLRMEQVDLIRIVAHRLNQLGYGNTAIRLFDEVLRLRPEEPQSYRDLALAHADRADDEAAHGSPRAAVADNNRALSLLNDVVMKKWDDRFPEIETIALMEANRIIARSHANRSLSAGLIVPIDTRLIRNLPCDLRILLTWNTDETDQDLWVIEPTGEKCYYANNRTALGGRLSHDFTQGYGPEEYLLRHAARGLYKIQTNYYGQHSPELDGGTTVQATVITDWGRPTEKRRYLTVRVNQARDVVDIGTITR